MSTGGSWKRRYGADWEDIVISTTVGEVLAQSAGSIKTGPFGTKLSASEYSVSGVPVISVGEVGYGSISLSQRTKRVGPEVTSRLPEYLLEAGDIVFGRKGAVDRSAWVRPHEHGYFLGSDGIRLRFGEGIDSRFMAYQLGTPRVRNWLLQHAVGTTLASLNEPTLKAVPIEVPPIAVQRTIAATLGALDDKIESNVRAVSLQRDLAIALLNEAATQEFQLRDVAEIRKGISYKGEGLTAPGAGVPMVNMGSAENFGWLKRSGMKYYSGDYKPRHVAPAESLLITGVEQTWKNEIIGWPLLVPPDMGSVLFTHHMLLVAFSDDCEWMRLPVWAQLFTASCRAALEALIYGTTVATLPVAELGSLRVRAPSEDSPAIPAAAALLKRSWQLELESNSLAALRDTLLPELLAGHLSVEGTRVNWDKG